jgi:hypothetical protein
VALAVAGLLRLAITGEDPDGILLTGGVALVAVLVRARPAKTLGLLAAGVTGASASSSGCPRWPPDPAMAAREGGRRLFGQVSMQRLTTVTGRWGRHGRSSPPLVAC